MEAVQTFREMVILIALLLVPISFAISLFLAILSSEGRVQLRKRRWMYLSWFAASIWTIGVLVTPSSGGIRVAKEARTQARMYQIQTAILAYQTEYDRPPPGKDNASLIRELMSGNRRGIAFLNLKPTDMNAKGEALDAWGTPLRILLADPQHPVIQSAGPDKIWNTSDDMDNKKNQP